MCGTFGGWGYATFRSNDWTNLQPLNLNFTQVSDAGLVHLKGVTNLELLALGNTLFIAKSSPWENGYVESFNGKLRDELLNRALFLGLEDARSVIDRWRLDYNHQRGHSALDYQTPAAFAANCVLQDSATLGPSDHSLTIEPGFSHSRWYNNRG